MRRTVEDCGLPGSSGSNGCQPTHAHGRRDLANGTHSWLHDIVFIASTYMWQMIYLIGQGSRRLDEFPVCLLAKLEGAKLCETQTDRILQDPLSQDIDDRYRRAHAMY